ncbi:hypothetical protein BVRB_1g011430 [Beta vulgaris subsp. vulgaris]|nr:hypothetical protein BVRB_1g011430 [Beta vulgaris subsp. vulgaris]
MTATTIDYTWSDFLFVLCYQFNFKISGVDAQSTIHFVLYQLFIIHYVFGPGSCFLIS